MSAGAGDAPRARGTTLRLTASGGWLGLATLAATLAGTFTPGFARPLAALGASSLLLAALLGRLQMRALVPSELRPARGAVGARVRLFLVLRHEARWLAPRGLLFALFEPPLGVPFPAGARASLAREGAVVELVWRPRRRGLHTRMGIAVTSEAPLGLVRVTRTYELPCALLGLPRRGRLLGEPAPRPSPRAGRGRRERGEEELEHVRDWRAGESLHRLHWRLSAHRGRPILRELRAPAEEELELVLIPEVGALPARRPAFERAVSLVATLAEHYLRTGRRLTLTVPGEARLRALHGRGGLARALALLAEVAPRAGAADGAAALAGERGAQRIVVGAGAGGALARIEGRPLFDVDAPPGHPHHAPWHAPGLAQGDGR